MQINGDTTGRQRFRHKANQPVQGVHKNLIELVEHFISDFQIYFAGGGFGADGRSASQRARLRQPYRPWLWLRRGFGFGLGLGFFAGDDGI